MYFKMNTSVQCCAPYVKCKITALLVVYVIYPAWLVKDVGFVATQSCETSGFVFIFQINIYIIGLANVVGNI